MCVISLCSISWEAFATLVAGLSAVVGAYRLGRRQVEILKRQTELQEANLKISIFDRRMDIFRAVEGLIHGSLSKGGAVEDEIERKFLMAKQESRFLFPST
ncbi:MAG: hypothetical protein KDE25_14220 [Novosphingobium sp.]|nr:hypothetical protein [Novosphingobium sp.]